MDSDDSDGSGNVIVVDIDRVAMDWDEELSGTSESEIETEDPAVANDDTIDYTTYDPEVTPYHLYMGNMECVTGMKFYDPKSCVRLHYTFHNSVLYPGEIIPMIFSSDSVSADEFGVEPIALLFVERTGLKDYGVTSQVVEKRLSSDHKIRAKIRVLQRFKLLTQLPTYPHQIVLLPHYSTETQANYVDVEILPEFHLGSPHQSDNTTYALTKWEKNNSLAKRMKLFKSVSLPWPGFVYTLYDIRRIMMKIQYFAEELGMDNMPTNPRQCSFWSARNLPLPDEDQVAIFKSNFVETRLLVVEKALNNPYKYVCMNCDQIIANFRDAFPMTKDGLQASYCNKNGFIHETVTVSCVEPESLVIEDHASTRYSWFPGYSWRIAYCNICSRHKGWKFTAVRKDLKPEFFYGLSRNGVLLKMFEKSTEGEVEEA